MIQRHKILQHGAPASQPPRVRNARTSTAEMSRRPSLCATRPPSLVGGLSASASSCSLARQRPRARQSTAVATAAAAAQSEGAASAPASASASASASLSPPSPPSAAAASWKALRDYSAAEFRKQARAWVDTPEKRASLRDTLMTAYRLPAPPESGYGWLGAGAGGGDAGSAAGAANAKAEGAEPVPPKPDVIVGVMASDARMAVRALRDWCAALGLPYVQPDVRLGGRDAPPPKPAGDAADGAASGGNNTLAALPPGPVYVKYAPAGGLCYASPYNGPDRGVLLQLGQAPLLGHFPLGLHDGGGGGGGGGAAP